MLWTTSGWAEPSTVIFGPESQPLAFSHEQHAARKIACDFCHAQASRSHRASDRLLPTEEVCATCHLIDHQAHDAHDPPRAMSATERKPMACAACHAGYRPGADVARVVIPPPNLVFDHAAHATRGIPCQRCHEAVERVELATRAQLPTMALCLGCHDSRLGGQHAPSRCSTCHLMQPDGTLQTDFATGTLTPSGVLRGDQHTLEFRTSHAAVAAHDDRYCGSCHRQSFCLECHNGVVKPLDIHGNDYVSRHAVDARKDDPRCDGCHRRQSFCLGCHQRMGVVDALAGGKLFAPIGGQRFHPAGWSDPVAGPNHHKWQAERNLKSCVSCHRQETCLQCHATPGGSEGTAGKMSVDPHPPDWRGSTRCQSLADRNLRVCLRCHAAGDSQLSCR